MNRWIYIDWSLSYHKILKPKNKHKPSLIQPAQGVEDCLLTSSSNYLLFMSMHIHINRRETKLGAKRKCVFLCTQCGIPAFPHSLHLNLTGRSPQQSPTVYVLLCTLLLSETFLLVFHVCASFCLSCLLMQNILASFVFNYNWFCLVQ